MTPPRTLPTPLTAPAIGPSPAAPTAPPVTILAEPSPEDATSDTADASAEPAPSPSSRPGAAGSPRPKAMPSADGSAKSREPLWNSRPSHPVAPAENAEAAANEGDDDAGETVPVEPAVGGRWELTHEIEATSYAAYSGMRLGYRLNLQQDGDRVYGHGRKVSENGVPLPADQRTEISVEGRIEGQYLVLSFVEEGGLRSSAGTIRWLIAPGAGSMQGRFASDAAQSSGTSVARRLR